MTTKATTKTKANPMPAKKRLVKKPSKALQVKESKLDHGPLRGHTGYYIGGFMVALLLFVATAFMAHKGFYMGWEIAVFQFLNNWSESWRGFFLIATIVPTASLWIGFSAMLIAFLFRMYRLTWRLSVALIGGSAAAFLAKELIARPRPEALLTDAHVRIAETGMGYPSGHVMIITVVMLMLVPYVARRWWWLLAVPIVLMAAARMYLGVHTPLDLIGGFALGLGIVSFLRIVPQSVKVFCRLD